MTMAEQTGLVADQWHALRRLTPARIALGRSGVSLPTDAVLALAEAHAQARDAVHRPLDAAALAAATGGIVVESAAPDRATYLRRPDLGRSLSEASRAALAGLRGEVAIVLADGLSPGAVAGIAPDVLAALLPLLERAGFSRAMPVVATQARVALGDEVAACLQARVVVVLIGERPGLSVPSSLGAYLTWAPRPGISTDADRNCVSNIQPRGLSPEDAAARIAWLLNAARARGGSGVALKDESGGGGGALIGPTARDL